MASDADHFDFVETDRGPSTEDPSVDEEALILAEAAVDGARAGAWGVSFSESLASFGGPSAEADEVLTTITLAFLGDPDTIA
jgi:hypothetical protein